MTPLSDKRITWKQFVIGMILAWLSGWAFERLNELHWGRGILW